MPSDRFVVEVRLPVSVLPYCDLLGQFERYDTWCRQNEIALPVKSADTLIMAAGGFQVLLRFVFRNKTAAAMFRLAWG